MTSNQERNTAEDNEDPQDSFNINAIIKKLPLMIPPLIKIIFSTAPNDRLEGITAIGKILNIENLISSALQSFQQLNDC